MRKIIIVLTFVIASNCASAQDYVETIRRIAAQSLEFRSYKTLLVADSLDARRGLNPDDPEIDFSYSFDNSTEVSLTQSFDFPSVYVQRSKIGKLNAERANIGFRSSNRELMLEISEQYISLIYYTKLAAILDDRASRLRDYVDKTKQGVELGESTMLNLELAETLKAQMLAELNMARASEKQCVNNLAKWGYVERVDGEYPFFTHLSCDEFLELALKSDMALEAVKIDSLVANRLLKLSRNEWIPSLKVGYKMELENGGKSNRSSIIAGISIPLWKNSNNIKHSKALIEHAEAQSAATINSVTTALSNLYITYEFTENSLYMYPEDSDSHIEMLTKSLDHGAMTYVEYLLAVIDRYEIEQKRMELERENVQNRAMMAILMDQ